MTKHERAFWLENTVVEYDHCDLFCLGFKDPRARRVVDTLVFINNRLYDEHFQAIFSSARHLEAVRKVDIRSNRVESVACLKELLPILRRSPPFQLRELKLVDCHMSQEFLCGLLKQLSIRSHIESLTLQDISFQDKAASLLAKTICTSTVLSSIDLSRNRINSPNWLLILEALSYSQRITSINLSTNNNFHDKYHKPFVNTKLRELPNEALLAARLSKICKSPKLLHLNLDSTGLTKTIALEIFTAVRKAPSLLCLHMSFNPFILKIKHDKVSAFLNSKVDLALSRQLMQAETFTYSRMKTALHQQQVVSCPFIIQRKIDINLDLDQDQTWEIVINPHKHFDCRHLKESSIVKHLTKMPSPSKRMRDMSKALEKVEQLQTGTAD